MGHLAQIGDFGRDGGGSAGIGSGVAETAGGPSTGSGESGATSITSSEWPETVKMPTRSEPGKCQNVQAKGACS